MREERIIYTCFWLVEKDGWIPYRLDAASSVFHKETGEEKVKILIFVDKTLAIKYPNYKDEKRESKCSVRHKFSANMSFFDKVVAHLNR